MIPYIIRKAQGDELLVLSATPNNHKEQGPAIFYTCRGKDGGMIMLPSSLISSYDFVKFYEKGDLE